jgi:hypothetical protein
VTTSTPDTPATTDFPDDREMLALIGATRTDRDLRQLRESMREFVAAREAAAYARGRGEFTRAQHEFAAETGRIQGVADAEIARLRAEVAAARQRIDAVKALHQPPAHLVLFAAAGGISLVCPECSQSHPCPTARAAAVATPDATREGDPSA